MNSPELLPASSSRRPALIKVLQQHALARSITYGVVVNAIGFSVSYILDPSRAQEWSMPRLLTLHTIVAPLVASVTYAFVTLRDEDRDWWERTVIKRSLRDLGLGSLLGSGVYLAGIAVALGSGWVHFPVKGWQGPLQPQVVRTLISHLANLCIAWNEEMLYRGYGLHSLSQAIGFPAAVALLVPMFAWGHGEGWQVFVGQSTFGLALTGLRIVSNSIWLPIGYHAAWNYIQTAVLGPPDASPSILPMHVDGPHLWMGQPGYPVPGLISTITNLSVAAGAALVWRHFRRSADHRPDA